MTAAEASLRCPCCGSDTSVTVHRLRSFDVYRCVVCTLLFRHPLPKAESLEGLYEDVSYHESQYFRNTTAAYDSSSPEVTIYRTAVKELARLCPGGSLLDVGCGRGVFLDLARKEGFSVRGIDLSQRHAAWARDQFGVDVWVGDFLASPATSSSFQVVTMWDFLEHVLDPVAVLQRARELLAPGGVLLVFTIDSSSLFNSIGLAAARFGGSALPGMERAIELLYDERHNLYFTRKSLERLLRSQGFESAAWFSHRAYLGRWLSEPAPFWLRAAGAVVDWVGSGVGRPYRRTAIFRRS